MTDLDILIIKDTIEKQINPILQMHNGYCELVKTVGFNVHLRLQGGCVGCPSSKLTLFQGILPTLQDKLPHIQDVVLEQ